MLSEHPHIERVRVHERLIGRRLHQKLVVETNLPVPDSGPLADSDDLAALRQYLNTRPAQDFVDFCEVDIRPFRKTRARTGRC